MKCRCGKPLPAGRQLTKCTECQAAYYAIWRAKNDLGPTAEFPGVDIDAIHFTRRKSGQS